MHLSGHSELSPDKILFCVKKATEKVSEMQQIVEKALKEDEKLRKKGIIPRLSTDIFDEPFDFDENSKSCGVTLSPSPSTGS